MHFESEVNIMANFVVEFPLKIEKYQLGEQGNE